LYNNDPGSHNYKSKRFPSCAVNSLNLKVRFKTIIITFRSSKKINRSIKSPR